MPRELGADPDRVAVGGDSAGGNLAALVSLRARDEGVPLPALQLLFYPVTNYSGETRSQTLFADGFLPHQARPALVPPSSSSTARRSTPADPRVSPLLADDLSGLPPALVLTAGFDPAARRGQAVRRRAARRRVWPSTTANSVR